MSPTQAATSPILLLLPIQGIHVGSACPAEHEATVGPSVSTQPELAPLVSEPPPKPSLVQCPSDTPAQSILASWRSTGPMQGFPYASCLILWFEEWEGRKNTKKCSILLRSPAQGQRRWRAAASLAAATVPGCREAGGKERLMGCARGSCWQGESIPAPRSNTLSCVGEGRFGRACRGGCTAWPPGDPAGQHGCGCTLAARAGVNQGWFRRGSSLGSRCWGRTGLSANGSMPWQVPLRLLVMLDQPWDPHLTDNQHNRALISAVQLHFP